MVGKQFNTRPESVFREQLALFEDNLRRQVIDRLSPIQQQDESAFPGPDGPRRFGILKDILAAMEHTGPAALAFAYEKALPVSAAHAKHSFDEALIRLRSGNGDAITIGPLFDALQNANDPELATSFRLWLIFAAIRDFYEAPETAALSVNVVPHDLDSAAYRDSLDAGLTLFKKCGYGALILEATEYDPWTPERLSFIREMAHKHELTLAIDDYGAANNKSDILAGFAEGLPPGGLIVKIDGQLAVDFLQDKNQDLIDRLREVKALVNRPLVVVEWVPGIEGGRALLNRLRPYGLDDLVVMMQSNLLQDETPESLPGKITPSGPENI